MYIEKEMMVMETNNSVLGYVSKRFKDISRCNSLEESANVLSLLGTIISVMFYEESCELKANFSSDQSNFDNLSNIESANFNLHIDVIGKINEVTENFNPNYIFENENIEDYSDEQLGIYIKGKIKNRLSKAEDDKEFLKETFSKLSVIIEKEELAKNFQLKLPISGHVVQLKFHAEIKTVCLQ